MVWSDVVGLTAPSASVANVDLPVPTSDVHGIQIFAGGGSVRSIGSWVGPGSARVLISNWIGSSAITLIAGATGLPAGQTALGIMGGANLVLAPGESIEFYWDGSWREVNRNVGATLPARLGPGVQNGVTDWNSVTTTGWYSSEPNGATNLPPAIATGTVLGEVVAYSTDWVTQRVWLFYPPGQAMTGVVWRRFKESGVWGAWTTLGNPIYGTSLPASPADGMEYILVDSVTNPSYQWRFRFNAGQAALGYKWEFVGGAGAYSRSDVANAVSSTGFVDPANNCAFTVPRAGEYEVEFGGNLNFQNLILSVKKGGAATSDADGIGAASGGAMSFQGHRLIRSAGLNAGDVVKLQFRSTSGSSITNNQRYMKVTPLRVS